MLPERRWAHVCAIRRIVPVQRLCEVLLEPGDGVGNLAARRPRDDQVPKVRAMRAGQQVDELGFDPVDARGLDESWRQQPGTPCYPRTTRRCS